MRERHKKLVSTTIGALALECPPLVVCAASTYSLLGYMAADKCL